MTGARFPAAAVTAFLAILSTFPAASQPAGKMDSYIKDMPLERRTYLVGMYVVHGWVFSKFPKFEHPPAVYLSCAGEACKALPLGMLDNLRATAPLAFGEQVSEADAARIEIYVAPQPAAYEARDRAIDGKLRTDANISGRTLSPPPDPLPAPCWTVIYFGLHTGIIAKSLIFIDSDASPRMQSLCMGFELARISTGPRTGLPSTPICMD